MGSIPSNTLNRLGIPYPLRWAYLGLLLFMTGDGVDAGCLAVYLNQLGHTNTLVASMFTLYGLAVAVASWLAGALSGYWGSRRIMWAGCLIWVLGGAAFLAFGLPSRSPVWLIGLYSLRGFGYPLFAYGLLVWISSTTPQHRLSAAMGWFGFAFTAGFPVVGSLLASVLVPAVGTVSTLWCAWAVVLAGGWAALLGVRTVPDGAGDQESHPSPLAALAESITIAWQVPRTAVGCVVRIINTAPRFGFAVILPEFFLRTVGLSLNQWLRLLTLMFTANILGNLLFGFIGDRFGWVRTVAICGGLGSAVSTLLLYHLPLAGPDRYTLALVSAALYGATLAGFVPLAALMASLAPERRGAAISMLNLGAGASAWAGPALAGAFLPLVGVRGVMWVFAGLYLCSALLVLFLRPAAE